MNAERRTFGDQRSASKFQRLTFCVLLLSSAATGLAAQEDRASRSIGIYRPDGTLQCQNDPPISPESVVSALTASGVRIIAQEKRERPLLNDLTHCGTPTTSVYHFTIPLIDLPKVVLDTTKPGAFRVWAFGIKSVLVARSAWTADCSKPAVPLATMAQELADAGIAPIEMQTRIGPATNTNGYSIAGRGSISNVGGVTRTTGATPVCKRPNATSNVFRIPANQVVAARTLRYGEIISRTEAECLDVVAPAAGTPDFARLTLPQMSNLFFPPAGLPGKLRGKPIDITFYLNRSGGVDSVSTNPMLTGSYAKDFVNAAKEHAWHPAIFEGCAVPALGLTTITRS